MISELFAEISQQLGGSQSRTPVLCQALKKVKDNLVFVGGCTIQPDDTNDILQHNIGTKYKDDLLQTIDTAGQALFGGAERLVEI